jgi:hypothetical protein
MEIRVPFSMRRVLPGEEASLQIPRRDRC